MTEPGGCPFAGMCAIKPAKRTTKGLILGLPVETGKSPFWLRPIVVKKVFNGQEPVTPLSNWSKFTRSNGGHIINRANGQSHGPFSLNKQVIN